MPFVEMADAEEAARFAAASCFFCLMLKRAPHETQNCLAVGLSAEQFSHFFRGGVFGSVRAKRSSAFKPEDREFARECCAAAMAAASADGVEEEEALPAPVRVMALELASALGVLLWLGALPPPASVSAT